MASSSESVPAKPGRKPLAIPAASWRDQQCVDEKAEQDHAEHARDHDLEAPVAARLEREQREGDHGGDESGGQQRQPEQQVERDRRPDELRQVGRHRDHLGLDPEADRDAPREVLAAQLGQAAPGRDADLGRQELDQHRHQVRGEDHPQQQIAELRTTGDVGREVARVDVRDRGHEGRSQKRQRSPDTAPRPPTRADEGGSLNGCFMGGHESDYGTPKPVSTRYIGAWPPYYAQ